MREGWGGKIFAHSVEKVMRATKEKAKTAAYPLHTRQNNRLTEAWGD